METLSKKFTKNLDSPLSREELLGLATLNYFNFITKFGVEELDAVMRALHLVAHELKHIGKFSPNTSMNQLEVIVKQILENRIQTSVGISYKEPDPYRDFLIASAPGPEEMSDADFQSAISALNRMGIPISFEQCAIS